MTRVLLAEDDPTISEPLARALPTMAEVAAIMHRHATLLTDAHGEQHGCSEEGREKEKFSH